MSDKIPGRRQGLVTLGSHSVGTHVRTPAYSPFPQACLSPNSCICLHIGCPRLLPYPIHPHPEPEQGDLSPQASEPRLPCSEMQRPPTVAQADPSPPCPLLALSHALLVPLGLQLLRLPSFIPHKELPCSAG